MRIVTYLCRPCVWFALCAALCPAAELKILEVQPSVLFPRAETLNQIAFVKVLNSGAEPLRATANVQIAGKTVQTELTIAPGASDQRVLVPDIDAPAKLLLELRAAGGERLAAAEQPWQPQRKWKVFIVRSSHEDLGYEDFIYKKQAENAAWVDIARRLSNPAMPMGRGQFHYTMESLLLMRNYSDEFSERKFRDLVEKQIKTGQMGLMGAPSGVHSHWMDYEEIARMTYPGRREVKDRYGLDLKTFMIVDNPSLSWSGAQAVASAGFKYVARWGQGWRSGGNNDYAHTRLPAIFWWQAPDRQHKVLFAWRSHYGLTFWYGQGAGGYGSNFNLASASVSSQLQQIEDGSALGPYPYDSVVIPSYVDHDIPRVDEGVLPAWNHKWAYPEIKIASPTDFFEDIEKRYGSALPTLSGDLNNFSADYATIDPESQGWKREAARTLPVAEGLAAIAGFMDPSIGPATAPAAKIWTQMFDYDEHSWPTQPKALDLHLFNAAWVKKQGALRAKESASALLDASWKHVVGNIPVTGSRVVVVMNPLAHARTDVALVEGVAGSLIDSASGKAIPCQSIDKNRCVFVAPDVPAYGYKVFQIAAAPAPNDGGVSATREEISNSFYKVRIDRATGNIASIVEKKTGRELVDPKAKYQFNQFVYVHKKSREAKDGFEHTPAKAARVESSAGPVRAQFSSWIDDDKTGAAIRQTVTLYAGIPRIDIVNRMEHAKPMFSNDYEDRYRDNVFYAFPVAVEGGQPRAEYPGGVVRPFDDQLRWGSHDYLSANRWVDVSTSNYGVTVAPWNEQVFDFGEIRYNQFSIDYKPQRPYLFGYAWSNRMAGLLTLNAQEANAAVGYSIAAHAGDWNSGAAAQLGWSVASPLVARLVEPHPGGSFDARQQSFLVVDQPNVEISVLKASETAGRGWIVRLVETAGKETQVELQSNVLPVQSAVECNLAEEDQKPLAVSGGRVRLSIAPFGFATVRLIAGAAGGDVKALRASSGSPDGISLAWQGGNASYNIYRSQDKDDPPTSYILLARSTRPAYVDRQVDPGTTYYYRVAEVSKTNLQGTPSEQVAVTSAVTNTKPPLAPAGASVIRIASDRLMLAWNRSVNQDVARYYIYRAESPDFRLEATEPAAVQPGNSYFLQTYLDSGLKPDCDYYYKVVAEDWAGNRSAAAATHARTPQQAQ